MPSQEEDAIAAAPEEKGRGKGGGRQKWVERVGEFQGKEKNQRPRGDTLHAAASVICGL